MTTKPLPTRQQCVEIGRAGGYVPTGGLPATVAKEIDYLVNKGRNGR